MPHPTLHFSALANIFAELEKTSSNLAMIDILAGFFKTASADDARIAAYLIGGGVAPDYEGLELGLAEKLALRAIAIAYDTPSPELERRLRRTGDLGSVVAEIAPRQSHAMLTLRQVFTELRRLALLTGTGSQEKKL
ncbi:MAG: DNA ligase, partial [Patescibacteria group bacterium]|nr:DNA ligase [Patescibacteria group bacterium]